MTTVASTREKLREELAATRRNTLCSMLSIQLRAQHCPEWESEYQFDIDPESPEITRLWRSDSSVPRRWRFDFAWPSVKVAVEVEGLGRVGNKGLTDDFDKQYGRHQTIKGYQSDLHKYNAAALRGWTLLRFSGKDIRNGHAIEIISTLLLRRKLSGPSDERSDER